jgi:hypothetical protein
MVLHSETLLPDDGNILGFLLTWFSKKNMIKEAMLSIWQQMRSRKETQTGRYGYVCS